MLCLVGISPIFKHKNFAFPAGSKKTSFVKVTFVLFSL